MAKMTRDHVMRSILLGLTCITIMISGCAQVPFVLKQTTLAKPAIFNRTDDFPRKIIFLSDKEARCPTRCSDAIQSETYRLWVSHIEQKLMERGYDLVSGSIVSRVENMLKENETRESWDRTEKALLLGKKTGADAIFEVRGLWIDLRKKTFLKQKAEKTFREVPERYAQKLVFENAASQDVSRFEMPYWLVWVELRMLDMDGNIIWSGNKSVRTTDIIPTAWETKLKPLYPDAVIATKFPGSTKIQNFDYDMYYFDNQLQDEQVILIIDDLISKLPAPGLKKQ